VHYSLLHTVANLKWDAVIKVNAYVLHTAAIPEACVDIIRSTRTQHLSLQKIDEFTRCCRNKLQNGIL